MLRFQLIYEVLSHFYDYVIGIARLVAISNSRVYIENVFSD